MFQSQQLSSDFLSFVKHLFLRQISAFILIFGRRGSGKTDLALLLTEILKEQDICKFFSTNVHIFSSSFPIEKITNLEDLKFWCKENKGRKVFLFDEIAKAMPRRKPMASLTVELINEFQILRKYKLSIIATTITEKHADSTILDPSIIDGYFDKPNWKDPKLAYYTDQLEDFFQDWHNLPKTNIKFDTYSSALFTKTSVKRKPKFKTKELDDLWNLTHGVTAEDLGLHSQQVARLWRKYVKESLEREHHASP